MTMHPLEKPGQDRWLFAAAQRRRRGCAVAIPITNAAPGALRIAVAVMTWLTAATIALWCTAQPPAGNTVRPGQPAGARPAAPPAANQGARPGVPQANPQGGRPAPPQANPQGGRPAPQAAAPPAGAPKPGAKPGAKKPEKPPMQSLDLVTKDQVRLRAYYFPSDKGKQAVPVIVMHEWQGQAGPYAPLVKTLWEAGCAVIVPEFRGHGGSREQEIGGRVREFDVNRMGKADVLSMMTGDLEAVKKFLAEENNAQRLNLNALTLIGIREGAVLAAHWAVRDLNFPSVGSIKQGQDVKAIVLISPERLHKGFNLDDTLADRTFWQLPFLIVAGQTSRQAADAERFHKRLETIKKRATRGEAVGLQFEQVPTSLDGHALINDAPGVIEKVKTFVVTEMVNNASKFPWIERP